MTEIDYTVKESERATKPRIDVKIRGVNVIIPQGSELNPEELVEEKKDWIVEKREKFDKYLEEAPERNFEAGETFMYKGEEKKLVFSEADRVKVTEDKLIVPNDESEEVEELLEDFFRERAEEHIQPVLKEYREKMNVDYEGVAFRNQKTLWGSCSSNENLSFNWRLIMTPPEVIRYVVVHELAHLKEKNHTKRFWRIVEEHHSDYKDCSDWLEENTPKLIFTREDL